jgi:hypothetical protein
MPAPSDALLVCDALLRAIASEKVRLSPLTERLSSLHSSLPKPAILSLGSLAPSFLGRHASLPTALLGKTLKINGAPRALPLTPHTPAAYIFIAKSFVFMENFDYALFFLIWFIFNLNFCCKTCVH